jgi:2-polyprenyl-6-methoxyphenol hydroxylase-like FAD-dependent oxidoreductase
VHVLVIGGGIGGLTAALCLERAGISARVFEAAHEIRPLGVGINVQANSVRVLTELGLFAALDATAIRTAELRFANRHGQTIWADPRGLDAGLPWPQLSIHRGELQTILWHAAQQRLGHDALVSGHRLTLFETLPDGRIRAHFVDRNGVPCGDAVGDVLIGADGIHSTVRAAFHPDEGPPKWNGILMWRGVSEGKPFLGGRSMVQAGHRKQKFVCYPISRRHAERGVALINWIADVHQEDRVMLRREDWNRPGRIEDFLPRFDGWNFGWLDVPAIVRASPAVYEFPMVDRDPLARWSHGRVTLLGDAAHPTYPIGSNGASQAILDAEAVAKALAGIADLAEALSVYERGRLPITTRFVEANRRQGIDRMLDIVEERAPAGFQHLDTVLPPEELEGIVGEYKRAAANDRQTLLRLAGATPDGLATA